MSEIKMEDAFNMPFVLYEGNIWCSGAEQVMPKKKEMHLRALSMCDDSGRLTIIKDAINSHDKLTEQNKMLREALIVVNEILAGCSNPPLPARASILEIKKALEKTK